MIKLTFKKKYHGIFGKPGCRNIKGRVMSFLKDKYDTEITSLGEFEKLFVDFIKEDFQEQTARRKQHNRNR